MRGKIMGIFVIPTNRIVNKAVNSASLEINAAREWVNKDITLVVVDNSDEKIMRQNTEYLKNYKKNSDFEIIHVDIKDQIKLIKDISIKSGIPFDELMNILLPQGIDYGKISNMVYIIVSMLNSDIFFRRDSDCDVNNIQKDEYPILQELKYLGKAINLVRDSLCNPFDADSFGEEEILVVGSDYLGEWNLDVKDLKDSNENTIRTLLKLNDVEEELIDYYIDIKYLGLLNDRAKKPALISVFNKKDSKELLNKDIFRYPECGNVSMKNVFKWIPNFIGQNGIGFDYNTQHLCSYLKVPILYHCSKINHVHDNNRKELSKLKLYWKGMVKQFDFSLLTTAFANELINSVKLDRNIIGLDRVIKLSSNIPDIIEDCYMKMNISERRQRVDILINDVLLLSKLDKYKPIADYLNESKEEIIKELNYEYEQSIKLYRLWPKIIEATSCLSKKENYFGSI